MAEIGLYGLAVMGQNLALNIASKGFKISVCNRSPGKVDDCVARAKKENLADKLTGYKDLKDFVQSVAKPRSIFLLVKAGAPVEAVIANLTPLLDKGDLIIDGGNEWYENTERRAEAAAAKGIAYMGCGVSGGEEGARFGPSLMPGGPKDAYKRVEKILVAISAKHKSGAECVTYLGPGGAGNYVKMVHNGIEYGDMQLIAEAYDLMKCIGGLDNDELAKVFSSWNEGDLQSFLIEITANIFKKMDDRGKDSKVHLVDKVLDKTGNKGTGKWTVKDAMDMGVTVPTLAAALQCRYMACLKDERVEAEKILGKPLMCKVVDGVQVALDDEKEAFKDETAKKNFITMVQRALYASKIAAYAQGMSLIQIKGEKCEWNLDLGKIASIWRGGCIIRAVFLDRITKAYDDSPKLANLLISKEFCKDVQEREKDLRAMVAMAAMKGVPTPAFSASLAYIDSYRRARLPANLTQSHRDYFGAHTYQRTDDVVGKDFVHSEWQKS